MRKLAIAAFAAAIALPAPAFAEDGMTFYIRNQNPQGVVLELHGQNRAWPGNGQVYAIDGKSRKSVTIECAEGENICYGAWINGNDRITWGVGPDNNRDCQDCCSICVSKTTTQVDIRVE